MLTDLIATVSSAEEAGYEGFTAGDGERDRAVVHRGIDAELVADLRDRQRVVGRLDLHPVLADTLLERFGRVENYDLALVDDPDAIAVLGLVHVVRRQEDRDVFAFPELVDVRPDRRPRLRIETHRRLVEEQHAGRVEQAARDFQPALHTTRERRNATLTPLPERDHLQHLSHPIGDDRLRDAVELGVEPKVLLRGRVVSSVVSWNTRPMLRRTSPRCETTS